MFIFSKVAGARVKNEHLDVFFIDLTKIVSTDLVVRFFVEHLSVVSSESEQYQKKS